jgi:hypothetical protein
VNTSEMVMLVPCAEHPVLARFHTGSALHVALLNALSALFQTRAAAAAPPPLVAAVLNLTSPTSGSALDQPGQQPRGRKAAGRPNGSFSQHSQRVTQLTQAAPAHYQPGASYDATAVATGVPRFSTTPLEVDVVPPEATAATPPLLTPALLQSLQLLTASLAGVKRHGWMALECTATLFGELMGACRDQINALHALHKASPESANGESAGDGGIGGCGWMDVRKGGAGAAATAAKGGAAALDAVQAAAAHGHLLACIGAVAIVEPSLGLSPLSAVFDVLDDPDSDPLEASDPPNLPFGWVVAFTRALAAAARRAGTAQAWEQANEAVEMRRIGLMHRVTSDLVVRSTALTSALQSDGFNVFARPHM